MRSCVSENVQGFPRAKPIPWRRLEWRSLAIYMALHLVSLGAIWSGVTRASLVLLGVGYVVHMFAVTAGYHRYFSHRTYKTTRVFQFVLAFLAEASAQNGVLWWASNHRRHHRESDQTGDLHSPLQQGLLYAHVLWIFDGNQDYDKSLVKDLEKFPELRFLNRNYLLPPTLWAVATFWIAGWPGLFIGFFLKTVLTWHGTYTINSLSHVWGTRRFNTTDDSRNNPVLALITMGEGWHNNHHHFMNSTRQGFAWYEFDISYMLLRVLAVFRIVWDLKEPPQRVMDAAR